ncbi:SRPBCC family protein [Blastococcus sp. SYSU D00820]
MRLRCAFSTDATPEQVLDAYTEFGPRRLEIWRDTLRPEHYELRERGDTWAVVREGSLRMGVVLRYDWSTPGTVTWTLLQSTFCDRGGGRLEVRPDGDGGARVQIVIEEHGGRGLAGRAVLGLKGLLGPTVLRRASKRSLDRFAAEARRPS